MKRIGIMTWWHNTNYGGSLQGIALQHVVEGLGFDCELINFSHHHVNFSFLSAFGPYNLSSWVQRIKTFVKALIAFLWNGKTKDRVQRLKRTKLFLDFYAKSSKRLFKSIAELEKSGLYYFVIVGSDQVWNPDFQDSDFSYLLAGASMEFPRMSYSSSVAKVSLGRYEPIYAAQLKKFSSLSVRERSNVALLSTITAKPVMWTVDPTLLLNANEWKILLSINCVAAERHHICLYWLSDFEGLLPKIEEFAQSQNCEVHVFTDLKGFCARSRTVVNGLRHALTRLYLAVHHSRLKLRLNADAREFIEDLATADYVVSDSFHALMFACIFAKKIKIIKTGQRSSMWSRIEDFLERVKGRGIVADDVTPSMFEDQVAFWDNNELNKWKVESLRYLQCSIDKIMHRRERKK